MSEGVSTVYIETVGDYLNILPELEEFSDRVMDKLTLYRGQGNKKWKLLPGALRNQEDFFNEELYLRECIRQYPEEFQAKSNIDMLIKMQHYGIPTRLLDLTRNPLVALYFACDSKQDEDGIVYVGNGPVARSSDICINTMVECLFSYESHGRIHIPESGIQLGDRHLSHDFVKRCINIKHPIVFQTDLSNPRIRNQNGYFAFFNISSSWEEASFSKKIYIKAENKDKIITQLSRIGIDTRYLFPEFSSATTCIVSSIKKRNIEINKRLGMHTNN